jgi:hypothetical protein
MFSYIFLNLRELFKSFSVLQKFMEECHINFERGLRNTAPVRHNGTELER